MNSLKRYFLKYKLNIASVITIFLAFIAVLSIYYSIEIRVQSNDECLWNPHKISSDSVKIVFEKVKINGVSYNAGIRDGDVLLEIDNITLKNTIQAQAILNKFKSGMHADYTVKKPDGEILKTKVYIKKLIQFGALAQAISALIYLLIGFIVYSAKPDGLAQKLFFGLGVFTVLASANILFPFDLFFRDFVMEQPLTAFFAGSVVMISQVLVPIILLYFVWSFSGSI